jgi:hypothetical protein
VDFEVTIALLGPAYASHYSAFDASPLALLRAAP